MSDEQKSWEQYISQIKRAGAGEYGTEHFMCLKNEHLKLLWAAERIAELEAENARLRVLVDRTCGDGCHCMSENNGKCAALLESRDE